MVHVYSLNSSTEKKKKAKTDKTNSMKRIYRHNYQWRL